MLRSARHALDHRTERLTELLDRHSPPPSIVADKILTAIAENRAHVTVGMIAQLTRSTLLRVVVLGVSATASSKRTESVRVFHREGSLKIPEREKFRHVRASTCDRNAARGAMSQTRLLLTVFLVISQALSGSTRAQDREFSGPSDEVADAWLSAAVRTEHDYDTTGRYIAMGMYGLIGGFLLIAPPLVANDRADVGPKGAAISMGAGALLLGAAATSALVRDPQRASHWATLVGSLGGIGMSLALSVSSLESRNFLPELTGREDSGARPDVLSSIYGTSLVIGFIGLGQLLSGFVIELALPPESPSVLHAEVAKLTPDARYDRIRDFLVRREQRRAWQEYTGAAAKIMTGGLTIYAAGMSEREGAQSLGQLTGVAMLLSAIGSLISYWVSDNPVSLLDDGVAPH